MSKARLGIIIIGLIGPIGLISLIFKARQGVIIIGLIGPIGLISLISKARLGIIIIGLIGPIGLISLMSKPKQPHYHSGQCGYDQIFKKTIQRVLKFNAKTHIPCCAIYRSIHKGCVICMLFVLNVAEDVLSTSIDSTHTETFCSTAVEEHEGVSLLYL